ncbi:hypothetical protein Angca_001831, partial [Angiostrongylus cantonensis]
INLKVEELESVALNLKETFGTARMESQNAVEAATAYGNLTHTLTNAREMAEWSNSEISKLNESLRENKDRVKEVLNSSTLLLHQTSALQQNTLNALEKEASVINKKVDRVSSKI